MPLIATNEFGFGDTTSGELYGVWGLLLTLWCVRTADTSQPLPHAPTIDRVVRRAYTNGDVRRGNAHFSRDPRPKKNRARSDPHLRLSRRLSFLFLPRRTRPLAPRTHSLSRFHAGARAQVHPGLLLRRPARRAPHDDARERARDRRARLRRALDVARGVPVFGLRALADGGRAARGHSCAFATRVWMPRRSARTLIAPLDMIHHSDSSWRASRASQPTAARFVSVTKYVTAGHCSRASEREEEGESTGLRTHAREPPSNADWGVLASSVCLSAARALPQPVFGRDGVSHKELIS